MTDQRIAEITRIMNTVERTRAKLQSENQCYTCALGSHDECGDYCEKAADDYECEDEGCSNFKDGTPSYAKIDEDDLGTLFDYIPYLLSQLAAKNAEIERLREAQRWIPVSEKPRRTQNCLAQYEDAEEQGRLVRVPCKIGDTVWAIRSYHGILRPQQGVVSEMYFRLDMTLQIVVKHVTRGELGRTIFLTRAEAEAALEGMQHE